MKTINIIIIAMLMLFGNNIYAQEIKGKVSTLSMAKGGTVTSTSICEIKVPDHVKVEYVKVLLGGARGQRVQKGEKGQKRKSTAKIYCPAPNSHGFGVFKRENGAITFELGEVPDSHKLKVLLVRKSESGESKARFQYIKVPLKIVTN